MGGWGKSGVGGAGEIGWVGGAGEIERMGGAVRGSGWVSGQIRGVDGWVGQIRGVGGADLVWGAAGRV